MELVCAYPTIVSLKAGELNSPFGRGRHPQLLVLFDRKVQPEIPLRTLDHLAFELPLEHFAAERERLQRRVLRPRKPSRKPGAQTSAG